VGVPQAGWYDEIFNSDSKHYGGSNVGNFPGMNAKKHLAQGRTLSLEVTLPPLGVVVLKPGDAKSVQ
jgi:1,4-alpha-glucan branching enzyme